MKVMALDITDIMRHLIDPGEQITGESAFHCAICDAEMYTAHNINGQFVMSAANLHHIMGATITHVVDTHGALMATHNLWEAGITTEEYSRRLDAIRDEACKVPMRECGVRHEGVCGDETTNNGHGEPTPDSASSDNDSASGDPASTPDTVDARS